MFNIEGPWLNCKTRVCENVSRYIEVLSAVVGKIYRETHINFILAKPDEQFLDIVTDGGTITITGNKWHFGASQDFVRRGLPGRLEGEWKNIDDLLSALNDVVSKYSVSPSYGDYADWWKDLIDSINHSVPIVVSDLEAVYSGKYSVTIQAFHPSKTEDPGAVDANILISSTGERKLGESRAYYSFTMDVMYSRKDTRTYFVSSVSAISANEDYRYANNDVEEKINGDRVKDLSKIILAFSKDIFIPGVRNFINRFGVMNIIKGAK